MIDKQVKSIYGSWVAFSRSQGEDSSNFKRKILRNIDKVNKWLAPLHLHIQVVNSHAGDKCIKCGGQLEIKEGVKCDDYIECAGCKTKVSKYEPKIIID